MFGSLPWLFQRYTLQGAFPLTFDLLPVLAKVFESFVSNWLHNLLDSAVDQYQFGCLKGRSTAHALISLLHFWCQTLDRGGSVRSLFADFSKAFDRVDHNVIVSKLIDRGVPHFLIRWLLCSYLTHRRQSVRVDGQCSDWLSLASGICLKDLSLSH